MYPLPCASKPASAVLDLDVVLDLDLGGPEVAGGSGEPALLGEVQDQDRVYRYVSVCVHGHARSMRY